MDIIKQIESMDKKSDEFHELFQTINDKYFDFDNPDSYQSACKSLNLILHRGDEWMIEMMGRLAIELFKMVDQKVPAAHGNFSVKGREIFFDFYTDKNALSSIHKMLRNTVIQKSMDNKGE